MWHYHDMFHITCLKLNLSYRSYVEKSRRGEERRGEKRREMISTRPGVFWRTQLIFFLFFFAWRDWRSFYDCFPLPCFVVLFFSLSLPWPPPPPPIKWVPDIAIYIFFLLASQPTLHPEQNNNKKLLMFGKNVGNWLLSLGFFYVLYHST